MSIWLSGLGRSGTTALVCIFQELGYETSKDPETNPYEHPPVARLNDKIIQDLYEMGYPDQKKVARLDILEQKVVLDWPMNPMPPIFFQYLNIMQHDQWETGIKEVLKDAPEVIKDPRWSVTLPLWLRYAEELPKWILTMFRKPEQVALSWQAGLGPPKSWEDPVRSASLRAVNLFQACSRANEAGSKIICFKFPDVFMDLDAFTDRLQEVTNKDPKVLRSAINKVVDLSRIKEYRESKPNEKGAAEPLS